MSPEAVPFACQPFAQTPEQRACYAQLQPWLTEHRQGIEEHADGYAFHFEPSPVNVQLLAEFVGLERLCCPFLNLGVDWPATGPARLILSGPEGVKPFLQAELGTLIGDGRSQ